MKKDHLRDYCMNAFRTYAAAGRPTGESAAIVTCDYGALADIIAVMRTLEKLAKRRDGDLILRCVELVYFIMPSRKLEKNEISERVIAASVALHTGEATVYRKLRIARHEFAFVRGLNVGEAGGRVEVTEDAI